MHVHHLGLGDNRIKVGGTRRIISLLFALLLCAVGGGCFYLIYSYTSTVFNNDFGSRFFGAWLSVGPTFVFVLGILCLYEDFVERKHNQ